MPCSPKMDRCKASCLHRRFVMDYRAERLRQETELIESNYGYATEIADEIRVRAENGTPIVDFRTWLKMHKRPEEDEVVLPEDFVLKYGNLFAEETVLAVAMHNPKAVWIVNDLGPEKFLAHPMTEPIAQAIIDLERSGIRANAIAVESHLRGTVASIPYWDSSLPLGNVDRTEFGLQKWEKYSGVYANAEYCADEIRLHYQAYETERVLTWGRDTMRQIIMGGTDRQSIETLHRQIGERLESIGILPNSPTLTPAVARSSLQQPSQVRSR